MTRQFFIDLYCEEIVSAPFPLYGDFPTVSFPDWDFVHRPLATCEIKDTFFFPWVL